jgi:hypothetical protein
MSLGAPPQPGPLLLRRTRHVVRALHQHLPLVFIHFVQKRDQTWPLDEVAAISQIVRLSTLQNQSTKRNRSLVPTAALPLYFTHR